MSVPDYLKKVKIKKPLFSEKDVVIPIPTWIGEACVGLVFTLVQSVDSDDFHIIPDFLIESLKDQKPQPGSVRAADWIDECVWWGGGLAIKAEEVEILGPGEYDD